MSLLLTHQINMKNKKIIIISVVLILVLIVSVYLYYFTNGETKSDSAIKEANQSEELILEKNSQPEKTQKELQLDRINDVNVLGEAIKRGDISNCKNIKNENVKNSCYFDIAISNLDLSICDNINIDEDKDNCYLYVSQNKAILNKNISYCDGIVKKERCSELFNQAELMDFCLTEECINDLMLSDNDKDGLNDYDEKFKFKTDADSFDSDGDGYSDGEEVKNGFNPLGDSILN